MYWVLHRVRVCVMCVRVCVFVCACVRVWVLCVLVCVILLMGCGGRDDSLCTSICGV